MLDGRVVGLVFGREGGFGKALPAASIELYLRGLQIAWRPESVKPADLPKPQPVSRFKPGEVHIPALAATVSSMRFYETSEGPLPQHQRRYETRFATRGTRYINWELGLECSPQTPGRTFTLEQAWYYPNGSTIAQNHSYSVERGCKTAYLIDGRGNQSGVSFSLPGRHRVELRLDGSAIASGTFEVYEGDAPPSGYVQVIDATVTALRFYESALGAAMPHERRYGNRFAGVGARFINWELNLAYPKRGTRQDFTIHEVWRRPDGSILNRTDYAAWVLPGWDTSYHLNGWGHPAGGSWAPGTYRVDLMVESRVVASGTFEIF
jgi:hypothetical protein